VFSSDPIISTDLPSNVSDYDIFRCENCNKAWFYILDHYVQMEIEHPGHLNSYDKHYLKIINWSKIKDSSLDEETNNALD